MRDLPERWLVFRLSALGDVILTTGVLNHWHAGRGWRFHVVTREAFAPVFDNNPAATAIAAKDEDLRMPRMRAWFADLATEYAGWGLLDLHGTMRSRMLSFFWRGPVLRYPKFAIARRAFLYSGGRLFRESLNAANVPQRYALAVDATAPPASALLPAMYISGEERLFAQSFLANLFGDDVLKEASGRVGIVATHPFAAHPRKAWPREQYRALLAELDAQGVPWLVIGRGEPLFPGDARDVSNRTTLRQSAALLAACGALVTGDSGPMHMATAVNTPVVALFGPTTREWGFYPSGPHARVLERDMPCRPCSLHGNRDCSHECDCLARISPEEVLAALRDVGIPHAQCGRGLK